MGVWRDEAVALSGIARRPSRLSACADESRSDVCTRAGREARSGAGLQMVPSGSVGGEPYANRNRDNAEKKMTARQIEQAMTQAQMWVPKKM